MNEHVGKKHVDKGTLTQCLLRCSKLTSLKQMNQAQAEAARDRRISRRTILSLLKATATPLLFWRWTRRSG